LLPLRIQIWETTTPVSSAKSALFEWIRQGSSGACSAISRSADALISKSLGFTALPSILAATLFVFLPAAARAGIVAAHLGADPDGFGLFHRGSGFAHDVAPLRRTAPGWGGACAGAGAAEGAGGLVGRLLRDVAQEVLERHQAGGAAED